MSEVVMHRIAVALLCCLPILFIACRGEEKSGGASQPVKGVQANLDKVAWLIGSWYDKQEDDTNFEEWKYGEKHELVGRGSNATSFSERMRIVERNGTLVYIVTVGREQPVEFVATSVTGRDVTFENPAHDYPQRITYTQVTVDSIYARIDGTTDGEDLHDEFFYTRSR